MVDFDVIFSAVISILILLCFSTGISFLLEMKKVPKETDIGDTIHVWAGLVTGFCVRPPYHRVFDICVCFCSVRPAAQQPFDSTDFLRDL